MLFRFLLFQPFGQKEQTVEEGPVVSQSNHDEPAAQPLVDTADDPESTGQEEKLAEKMPKKEEAHREPSVSSEKKRKATPQDQQPPAGLDYAEDIFITDRRDDHLVKVESIYTGVSATRGGMDKSFDGESIMINQADESTMAQNKGDAIWADLDAASMGKQKDRMNLSVEVSTLYNYSSSMLESQINFAGGIISQIKISPHVSLNTGVVLSRQYFTTRKTGEAFYSYLIKNNSLSAVPTFEQSYARVSYMNTSISDVYNKVRLVGIDIPVNLEYQYRQFSVSAGISSLTYIQEDYRHGYTSSYLANAYDASNNLMESAQVTENELLKESFDPLSKLDLANILNLSVGYRIPLEHSQLVIEPFMKHPLGDLASRDIRFGSRGLRLRMRF